MNDQDIVQDQSTSALDSEAEPRIIIPMDASRIAQGLKELYPDLSESEIRAARLTLEQYFALAWEIYEESILKNADVDFLQ